MGVPFSYSACLAPVRGFSTQLTANIMLVMPQQHPYQENFMHMSAFQHQQYNLVAQSQGAAPSVTFQQPQHTPAPAPARPVRVCSSWARDGRCPMKNCPFASSHTAQNSPRYAKFRAGQAGTTVVAES